MKISLTCVKIRRFRLFNSSMNSAILSVERYDFANTVTIIANRLSVSLSVSMFVSLRLFVKRKKRNPAFNPVESPTSRPHDAVFSPAPPATFDALPVSPAPLSAVSFFVFVPAHQLSPS